MNTLMLLVKKIYPDLSISKLQNTSFKKSQSQLKSMLQSIFTDQGNSTYEFSGNFLDI